jgi:hypothetical protein
LVTLANPTTAPENSEEKPDIAGMLQSNFWKATETARLHHMITDILSQYRLVMEYLPEHQKELQISLYQLEYVKEIVENEQHQLKKDLEEILQSLNNVGNDCKAIGECL